MSLSEAEPTVEELRDLKLSDLLAGAQRKDCRSYANELLAPGRTPASGTARWRAYTLVAFVLSLRLDPDDDARPFKATGWFGALEPDDLTLPQLAALEGWLDDVSSSEIESRIVDLLWVARRPRDHRHGRRAVASYCASAACLAGPEEHWPDSLPRLQRAIVLARKFELVDDVERAIENILADGHGASQGPRDARLMQLLIDHGLGDPARWGAEAERRAEQLEAKAAGESWPTVTLAIAREFWAAAVGSRGRECGRESTQRVAAQLRGAETLVLEADKARYAGQLLVEAGLLGEAVNALRRAGASKERVEELVGRMRTAQRNAPRASIQTPVDLTEQVAKGRQTISGLDLREALHRLALIVELPRMAVLREMAEDFFSRSVAARLIPVSLTSTDHRVVKRMPALSGEGESDEDAMRWQMWAQASWLHLMACGYIHGARTQLLLEHQPRLADLAPVVQASWLVPPGHEMLFARGFQAGLYGDYSVACHILVPQLENGLRVFVEQALGKPMLSHRHDGTQKVRLLDRILGLPELAEVLGKDLIFDLQGLFVRQEGQNLRNRLAHGLVADGELGVTGMYCWWLCLRMALMLTPTVDPTGGEGQNESQDPGSVAREGDAG